MHATSFSSVSKRASRRYPRPITRSLLERKMLGYVARVVTSEVRLRIFIARTIKSRREAGREIQVTDEEIEEIIAQFRVRGYIDDLRFAEIRIARWYKAGHALRSIHQKLRAEQLDQNTIHTAYENFIAAHSDAEDAEEFDRAAAWQYARKRGLGPYRQKDRARWTERDLAKMGRRGFSLEVARTVIHGSIPNAQ